MPGRRGGARAEAGGRDQVDSGHDGGKRAAVTAVSELAGLVGAENVSTDELDLICYSLDSTKSLVDSLRGQVQHFLHCGTLWVHGHSVQVPTTEEQPRFPLEGYGKQKAAIEAYLLQEAHVRQFPATVLHPGHIVGPGWPPINPAGHSNPKVFEALARGEELVLPNLGMETLHHVHADDVAQSFMKAMAHWSHAAGESFHVASPAALTMRGYAEAVAGWFGRKARLQFLPWEEWKKTATAEETRLTWSHLAHSPCHSIAKAQRLLNYQPRYRSLEAVLEAVNWLIENQVIKV